LFHAVHAEARKRKLDHDALHDMCVRNYGVRSMSELSDAQLLAIYRSWTGKVLRSRGKLPARGEAAKSGAAAEMVSAEDLAMLDQEWAKRGLGVDGRAAFVRRQLRGRDVIRTRRDWVRVMGGIRQMNRRDGI
jgi:hypothetical protein